MADFQVKARRLAFFVIHPSGESMFVANEGSDSVVRFRIDEATGRLHLEGAVIQTGSPVCIVFRPAAKAA